MENASKALIIAGAILISIILISIGIMVIQAGNSVGSDAEDKMDQQAIQVFNSDFVNYVGARRGSAVKALLQSVQSSNALHAEDDLLIDVTVDGTACGTDQNAIGAAMANIRPSTNYTVNVEYSKAGRVNKITITKTTGSGSGTTTGG